MQNEDQNIRLELLGGEWRRSVTGIRAGTKSTFLELERRTLDTGQ